ncbi:MAG: hypothetical protein RBS17_04970 [Coriobacteriia bacterium]|nr:hypothetical protein [Coriobacteriia bacterium]
MSKPKCVLLDAGPIIALHAGEVWTVFCERFDVVVPETVADNEALWHSKDEVTGARTTINLRADEDSGRLRIESATSSELLGLAARFDDAFATGLHEGELEGLALLTERDTFEDTIFCAGDGAAIQAAVMVGLDERCESLEALLESVGLVKPLEWPFTRGFHDRHRREGLDNRLSGLGLHR